MRANHAKILVGIEGAEFRVSQNIPRDLAVGFLSEPGKTFRANVRFSNASSEFRADDSMPDLRGVAIRVFTDLGSHDFLMTNAEPHHDIDAREAMVAITAGTKKETVADALPDLGSLGDKISGLIGAFPHLVTHLGLGPARRIAGTLRNKWLARSKTWITRRTGAVDQDGPGLPSSLAGPVGEVINRRYLVFGGRGKGPLFLAREVPGVSNPHLRPFGALFACI